MVEITCSYYFSITSMVIFRERINIFSYMNDSWLIHLAFTYPYYLEYYTFNFILTIWIHLSIHITFISPNMIKHSFMYIIIYFIILIYFWRHEMDTMVMDLAPKFIFPFQIQNWQT